VVLIEAAVALRHVPVAVAAREPVVVVAVRGAVDAAERQGLQP
jgi:hypothetical protein